jgi:molybdate transport system substrate-binding protein
MKRTTLILAVLLLAGAVLLLLPRLRPARPAGSLTVYCAAELRPPVEAVAAAYRQEFRARVSFRYGDGPATLEAARAARQGDLLIATDDATFAEARRAGLIRETIPLATRCDSSGQQVTVAVLAACTQPAAALQFARYLAAPEKGGPTFARHGLRPLAGDTWAERPELVVYSGGVNRLSIEDLLTSFSDREGVEITTAYNGCGILCGSMRLLARAGTSRLPDVYYACDVSYLAPVAQWFPEAVVLTETDIVIAVPKGNPRGIRALQDLAAPGMRVGLCNAEQATLGHLTQELLKSEGLTERVQRNVKVEVPTADFLVNQMRTGALDAIVVYEVNVRSVAEHLEAIALNHPGARAMQPFAVRRDSPRRQLAQRLLAHFRAHRASFERAGFRWRNEAFPVRPGPGC